MYQHRHLRADKSLQPIHGPERPEVTDRQKQAGSDRQRETNNVYTVILAGVKFVHFAFCLLLYLKFRGGENNRREIFQD